MKLSGREDRSRVFMGAVQKIKLAGTEDQNSLWRVSKLFYANKIRKYTDFFIITPLYVSLKEKYISRLAAVRSRKEDKEISFIPQAPLDFRATQ